MAISLAMLDVDGTLRSREQWLPGARELVADLVERQVKVALCSGRSVGSLQSLAADLGVVSYLCAGSGCVALKLDGDDWALLGERTLAPELVDFAVAYAQEHGIEVWLFGAHGWYVADRGPEVLRDETEVGDIAIVTKLFGRSDIGKVLFLDRHAEHVDAIRNFPIPEHMVIVSSGHAYHDLIHQETTKDKGGGFLLRDLGIGWDQVMAMGDGENDLGMLTQAGAAMAIKPLTLAELPAPSSGQTRLTIDGISEARAWVRENL